MELTHLIPMEDFVLKTVQTPFENEAICWEQTQKRLDAIYRYALFLKQKPELWMFVACDAEGKPMNKPSCDCNTEFDREGCPDECWDYINCKNECLFEGFEVVEDNRYFITVGSGTQQISFDKETPSVASKNDKEIKTISDLCQFNLPLTQTAIDKIYN